MPRGAVRGEETHPAPEWRHLPPAAAASQTDRRPAVGGGDGGGRGGGNTAVTRANEMTQNARIPYSYKRQSKDASLR